MLSAITEEEYLIFIREIGRLLSDYSKCEDENLKEVMGTDILLLSEILDQ